MHDESKATKSWLCGGKSSELDELLSQRRKVRQAAQVAENIDLVRSKEVEEKFLRLGEQPAI